MMTMMMMMTMTMTMTNRLINRKRSRNPDRQRETEKITKALRRRRSSPWLMLLQKGAIRRREAQFAELTANDKP